MKKKVLLLHISNVSGHRSASFAIERALQELNQSVQVKNIDGFNYTSPLAEKIINRLYMFVIKTIPRFWDYLYDNKDVLKKLSPTRNLVHRVKTKKIKKLFADFEPDIIVCTQAFPCGMVADYKRRHNLKLPLIGVLTDYAPHSYWLNDSVDLYVVPAAEIRQKLIQKGISPERLQTLGIPIDTKFSRPCNRDQICRRLGLSPDLPVVLIMGGAQGLGPIKEIVRRLDQLPQQMQMIVVCGTNRALLKWLNKYRSFSNKHLICVGYTEQIDELMAISSFIITKPGGLTSAEALSKSLPIIIVNPLPGQESQNTQFLLEAGVALQAKNTQQLKCLVEELLNRTEQLEKLRQRAASLAQPNSALKIAQVILERLKED